MDNCSQEIDLLFESSWEVCNKIGGIYTVLSTKAKTLKDTFKDKLIFIGPDVWSESNPSPYFVESKTLMRGWLRNCNLPEGIEVRVGRWDIPGKPVAILVKFDGLYANKDVEYGRMWELYKVDSLHAYGDYDEGCAFARASAEVIESIVAYTKTNPRNVVALFDEWTTAMGLLKLKAEMPEVATVFTTHATSIGRSICGNGKPLYDYLSNYDGDQMAAELNMQSKHSLEKAAAWNADCFTTVSGVTADEAEQLLGVRPEVTPNGFELNFVPSKNKYAAARAAARKRMLEAASALTGVAYDDDTFIVATSGRCEYRNKGLDMYLDAIKELSDKAPSRKVLAFVLVPAWSAGPRPDLAQHLAMGERSRLSDPVLTHRLNNYSDDPVNGRIHQLGFTNDANSACTVIYVPCYLDGADGIFDMTYYQLLPGLDATVFASYYEPWGYTPLESVAFGVPTITTTLAGFGRWVMEIDSKPSFVSCGVEVVERTDSNYDNAKSAIANLLGTLAAFDATQTAEARSAAAATAAKAQWTDFIKYYYTAFRDAFTQRDERIQK
ncbi:MAG: glycogen/starch synthase [Muribaculaceae bacterium]|nr:glycogen/starch synthase [Muribaculaceae bacterium]